MPNGCYGGVTIDRSKINASSLSPLINIGSKEVWLF